MTTTPPQPVPVKYTSSGITSGLVSLVALVLVGCASSPERPAPEGMRRVFLSSAAAAGGTYQSEILYGGTPTDHFDAKQDRGYLYLVFNDRNDHTMLQFTVRGALTGVAYIKTSRVQLTGKPGSATWRGYSQWFQIAGRLAPGPYVLDLIVDDRAAGAYPFTVSP